MEEGTATLGSQRKLPSWQGRRPLRVLVVDDYPDNAESMAMLLRLYGHEVDTALGGRTAISKARTIKPDVALLDISMPVMDGFEVAGQLRKMYHEGIVLIAVTANGSQEDQKRSLEAGFNLHIVKPADPKKLEDILRTLASTLEQMASSRTGP